MLPDPIKSTLLCQGREHVAGASAYSLLRHFFGSANIQANFTTHTTTAIAAAIAGRPNPRVAPDIKPAAKPTASASMQ